MRTYKDIEFEADNDIFAVVKAIIGVAYIGLLVLIVIGAPKLGC